MRVRDGGYRCDGVPVRREDERACVKVSVNMMLARDA